MLSLPDPRTTNQVLSSLKVSSLDKIISIKENGHADSNFIITHLMKQIFHCKNRLCLVSLHNTFEHYLNVGKKLGYNLNEAIKNDEAKIIEPIKDIADNIGEEDNFYLLEDKEAIVKCLFVKIKKNVDDLLSNINDKELYIIIDDVSHLLDLGVDVKYILTFLNYCIGLTNEDRIFFVISTHVCTKSDEIISTSLQYVADLHVDVSPLKTGRSNDVTGVMNIERATGKIHYQYKAFDRGIKTFHPGESIYRL